MAEMNLEDLGTLAKNLSISVAYLGIAGLGFVVGNAIVASVVSLL